jgi:hypothetical protein
MFAERAFFSFTSIPDPANHRAYNEWHQLDHRPENLALPGVVGGERWVSSPACAAASSCAPELAGLHYVNMYWFAPPAATSVAAWEELAERSFQWGRRDDVHLAERLLMEHVRPVDGWVAPGVRLSPAALAFRPNRGIVLTVTRFAEPRSAAAERRYRWWQDEHVPAQLARDGVVGCWTFAAESNFAVHADLAGGSPAPSTRFAVFYVDGDPVEAAAEFDAVDDMPDVESVVFQGPLLSILPWQWDWFDRPA